ncbi:MAG: hypothetical protein DRJ51_00800 [Thermoprotei archaeon]|nr:MAG: hypothetical protein DRJ36_02370 [Thermoprotei archaeon]RLE82655.1 MAG: hypothetical protein DRJ51_00800 [Thermoprotei archaeon]RLF03590.1 MAG: hypothetical protein DRJ59_00165 [Thermoprotei archaeon]
MLAILEATAIVILIALSNAVLQRLVLNVRKIERLSQEIHRWQEIREESIRKKDKKLFLKTEREKRRIKKLKAELDKEKAKNYAISIALWFAGLKLAEMILGKGFSIYLPPLGIPIGFIGWYIIVSLWMFPLSSRVIAGRVYAMLSTVRGWM